MPTRPASVMPQGPIGRWIRFWNVLAYIMLVISTGIALLDPGLTPRSRLLCLVLSLLFGVWYWLCVTRWEFWCNKKALQALSFVFIICLSLYLSTLNTAYFVLLFSMYGLSFSVLGSNWAIPVVVFLSVGILWRFLGSLRLDLLVENTGLVLGIFFSTVSTVMLGMFIGTIIRQSQERQRMIEELRATRDELAAAGRQAGILEERQRLAREIHDTLAQGFTSIVMHLEAAEAALPPESGLFTEGTPLGEPGNPDRPGFAGVRQHLDRARQTARDSLAEARRVVWALHPEMLERETLSEAITRTAARWAEEGTTSARIEVSGDPHLLPAPYEVTLLRAAQEALANVRKHARAAQVVLTLTYMDDQVILDVQDDGQGFSPALLAGGSQAAQGGFGLIAMRQRVEQLGGSLEVESAPGEGTTLAITLPLAPTQLQEEKH